jgi:hypothetical protein
VTEPTETTVHRGIRWRRDEGGKVSFYDADGKRWVAWSAKGDNPPLPPGWSMLGVPTRVTRPGWRSRWRLVPIVLIVVAMVIAIIQSTHPSGNPVAKEAAAAQALLGKCLTQKGTANGQPVYSSTAVACDAHDAAVRVVQVLSTGPQASPSCPGGTVGFSLAYTGVRYPHILCTQSVRPG